MNKNRKRILWITQTAIFIALLIVIQVVTKPLTQWVTGSLVNLILITSVLTCGLASGLVVSVISPVIATLLGIGPPFWVLVPFIILGNCTIVLLWYFIAVRTFKDKITGYFVALPVAAVAKFLVLYLTIVKLAIPMFLNLPENKAAVISAAFSVTQLFTALIGGAVALAAVPVIKKATAGRQS